MASIKPDHAWRDARAKAQKAATSIGWQLVVPAGWVTMLESAVLSGLGKQTAAKLVAALVAAVERMQGKTETDAHVKWRADVADAAALIARIDGGSASETDREALEQRRQALLNGGIDAVRRFKRRSPRSPPAGCPALSLPQLSLLLRAPPLPAAGLLAFR